MYQVPSTAEDMLPPKQPKKKKITNANTRKQYAKLIKAALRKSVDGFMEAGRALIEAKEKLPHGQFEVMVEQDLRMLTTIARMLMSIARHPIISNHHNYDVLPPTVITLYALSRVPEHRLEVALADGTIHPGMKRKDVTPLLPARRSRKQTPVDDDPEAGTPSSSGLDKDEQGMGATVKQKRKKLSKALLPEANDFMRTALSFMADYHNKMVEWREEAKLTQEDREAISDTLHQVANELSILAQWFTIGDDND